MYLLEVVPPAFSRGPVFASGEPWRHNEQGHRVYLCFRHEQSDFCEARYASVKELVAEVLPKPEQDAPPDELTGDSRPPGAVQRTRAMPRHIGISASK